MRHFARSGNLKAKTAGKDERMNNKGHNQAGCEWSWVWCPFEVTKAGEYICYINEKVKSQNMFSINNIIRVSINICSPSQHIAFLFYNATQAFSKRNITNFIRKWHIVCHLRTDKPPVELFNYLAVHTRPVDLLHFTWLLFIFWKYD